MCVVPRMAKFALFLSLTLASLRIHAASDAIDAEALANADYAGAAELWIKKKDKAAAWHMEAVTYVAAEWPKMLHALNKKVAPESKLSAYLPNQRLRDMPLKSFDARGGVMLDMGKGATTSVTWKNVPIAERLELARLAGPEDAPENLRLRYCLALVHGKVAEASELYMAAGKPAPEKGAVEAYLAAEAGKHTEELQRAYVQSCLEALEKFKVAGDPRLLDSFLRTHETRIAANPFAEQVRTRVAELKAGFEQAQAAAEKAKAEAEQARAEAEKAATLPPPPADGRKVIFTMDFSRPAWGKIVPVDTNDFRGTVIPDPTGGSGKVLAARTLYDIPGAYVGAAAHTELPGNAFYTVGPNTYFDVEVYYEGMTDPAAYVEVKGNRGEQRITGRLLLGELKEKAWQRVSLPVSEGKITAHLRRENDLPKNGDRFVLISFHADLGCTRRVQKLYFRNLVIYELPPKK